MLNKWRPVLHCQMESVAFAMSKGPCSVVLPTKKIVPSKGYQLMISYQSILEEESNVVSTAYGTCLESCCQLIINSCFSVSYVDEISLKKKAPPSIMGQGGQDMMQTPSMYSWRVLVPENTVALLTACGSICTSSACQPNDGCSTISNNSPLS